MSRVISKRIEVFVVSYGGVGTTSLIEFISRYKTTNDCDDYDGYKHLSIPPVSRNPDLKILYIYGDPMMACSSLFRRGFHRAQSIKLQAYWKFKADVIPYNESLGGYLETGIDKLCFEEHFNNWLDKYPLNDTMFIEFESMWENVEEILQFLELPREAAKDFPAIKTRNSSYDSLEEKALASLEGMYGQFAKRLNDYPAVFLVKNKKKNKWLTFNFFIAITKGFF